MFRKTVSSWDLFDTLVGRFLITPDSVFDLMERKTGVHGFKAARIQAQRDLDAIGKPYDLREIYRRFCESQGANVRSTVPSLFALEVATELEQLIPVHAQVSQVVRGDLIVSDMYLPEDVIADILQRVCGLRHNCFPPVVGNWGKVRGTLWPLIQRHYIVRCHHGDNRLADIAVPQQYEIPVRHVTDTGVTQWEKTLLEAGMQDVALVLREVRLRCLPAHAGSFECTVVNEYLAILLLFALFLRDYAQEHGIEHYLFAARGGVHISAIFRALMPGFHSETIDFNRRLLMSGKADAWFKSRLTPGCAVVDVVSSGHSLSQLCARIGISVPLITLIDVDVRLTPEQRRKRERSGSYALIRGDALKDMPNSIEALSDPGYPSVHEIEVDVESRAVIRGLTPDDQTRQEHEFAEFVRSAVTELAEVMRRRALNFEVADMTRLRSLLHDAARTLMKIGHHTNSPSYMQKNLFPQETY